METTAKPATRQLSDAEKKKLAKHAKFRAECRRLDQGFGVVRDKSEKGKPSKLRAVTPEEAEPFMRFILPDSVLAQPAE